MSYYYKIDDVNKKWYYNDVDPNDGDTWTEYSPTQYGIQISTAGLTITPYKENLNIVIGYNYSSPISTYLISGSNSSASPLTGDLSGFVIDTNKPFYYIGGQNTRYLQGITKLPKNYGLITGFSGGNDSNTIDLSGIEADFELLNTKYFNVISPNRKIIKGWENIEIMNSININEDDFSKYINLKKLIINSQFSKDTITLNNKLLNRIVCNSNNNIVNVNIENLSYGAFVSFNGSTYLQNVNFGDYVVIGGNLENAFKSTGIKNIKFNTNDYRFNSMFESCKKLETAEILFLTDFNSNKLNVNYMFSGCSNLTTVKSNIPSNDVIETNNSYPFSGCTKLVGGNGTTNTNGNGRGELFKNDNSTPGLLSYTNDKLYEHKVYSRTDYYYCLYDRFATDKLDVSFIPVMYETLDYWLQYNESDKTWKNVGSKIKLSGPVQSNQILVAVPKVGSGGTYTVNLSSVPSNSCTLTGAGLYSGGDNVVITVSPYEGYLFKQWEELINDTWVILSTDPIFTIEAIGRDRTIRAVLVKETPENSVELVLNTNGHGTVFGARKYLINTYAEASASADKGYKFVRWEDTNGKVISSSKVYRFIIKQNTTLTAIFEVDPYYNNGSSGTGGGGGSYDDTEDIVGGTEDCISNSAQYDGGLVSAYILSTDDCTNFANYIYSDGLLQIVKSIYDKIGSLGGNLSDYILSVMKMPVHFSRNEATKPVEMGWYATTLNFHKATDYIQRKSYGSINIEPYWGNALDYKSKIQIYLPYIGYEYLDTAEVMGKTISLYYNFSLTDGNCVAQIYVDNNLKYQFNGNCATNLPITESNASDLFQKSISMGASIITAGATSSSLESVGANNMFGGVPQIEANSESKLANVGSQLNDAMQMAMSNVGGDVRRSSNVGGNLGFISSQTPYIIISRPRLSLPDNYAHYHGFPSNITSKLGNLSGYTVVSNIHLDGLNATAEEVSELENILKTGIIIK